MVFLKPLHDLTFERNFTKTANTKEVIKTNKRKNEIKQNKTEITKQKQLQKGTRNVKFGGSLRGIMFLET